MTWSRSVWVVGLSVLLSCATVALAAEPAAAKLIDRSHLHFVLIIPNDNVCGVTVTRTIDEIVSLQDRSDKNGFPLLMGAAHGTDTSTNPDNGKSVVTTFAGVQKELTAVDNGDGTITVRAALTGVSEAVRLPDDTVALRDVGRVVLVYVRDASNFHTISLSIESISGPHPDLESGFTLFCPIFVSAIT